jgi:hypothetical protein
MIERALLYYLQAPPSLTAILEGAGFRSGGAPGPKGNPRKATIDVGGVHIELAWLSPEDMKAPVEALGELLASVRDLPDPTVRDRLKGAVGVVAVTVDRAPSLDEGAHYLRDLTRGTGAVVFFENGVVEDERGVRIASPDKIAPPEPAERPPPPMTSAEQVGKRALILAALAWRSGVESAKPRNAKQLVERSQAWLQEKGLLDAMEEAEKELAMAAPGKWSEEDVRTHGWGVEAAAVLAWALGRLELPQHDVQVQMPVVSQALGLFDAQPAALSSPVRPEPEIAAMGNRLLGIYWRIRQFLREPGLYDFEAFSRKAWFGGFDLAGIPIRSRDLAIDDMPIEYAPKKAVKVANSIAAERYRAAAWLQGKFEERLARD